MLEIKPFDRELLKSFVYDGVEREFSGEEILPIVEFYATLGSAFVGIIDNKVIGVGGAYPLWRGAGGCFLFLNREAQNHKKNVFKYLLEYMNMLIKQYEIKTLIVECQSDSLEANSLLSHLGFIRNRQVMMAVYSKNTGE